MSRGFGVLGDLGSSDHLVDQVQLRYKGTADSFVFWSTFSK